MGLAEQKKHNEAHDSQSVHATARRCDERSAGCVHVAVLPEPTRMDQRCYRTPTFNLLPVLNGLLDVGIGRLLPASPDLFTLTCCPFEYSPGAALPHEWLRFLGTLWPGDPASVDTLQEWFGYLLAPDTRQQKILFLLGPKRSGKGTICRVLSAVVGENNVAGPTLGSLAMNFGLSPLLGKSVAIVSDARLSG